ncbi:Polyketide synthase PksM [compost metagenome]
MKEIYQTILEETQKGKIDKSSAINLLSMLKQQPHLNMDVAIIGMAAEFPQSKDIDSFWKNLTEGRDLIRELPETRRSNADDYFSTLTTEKSGMEPQYNSGAFLDSVDEFDYAPFKLTPREASLMDPNQRLFLQTAWTCLEEAGYSGNQTRGKQVGVFLGYAAIDLFDYKRYIVSLEPEAYGTAMAGNLNSVIASRISYLLDLKGPSIVIDTACSSSLVAIHTAIQSLKQGDCEMALVGGVKSVLMPLKGKEKIGIESSDSRAKSFDDSSDGTGLGEGSAAILLKPLDRALKDGDNIHAVIKGSAVNQDGASIGITAPNVLAQEQVIKRAWKNANIDPATVTYIEAHGTGTRLGDPIEVEGITRAFRSFTEQKQFCAIGSLKSNIGHLDHAAGLAGLIKAVLCLQHKQLVPSLHFERPNRNISFEESPVYVVDHLSPWETPDAAPRRCGVSSFGMSGTNCHVVLEESPMHQAFAEPADPDLCHILTLSAMTDTALLALSKAYAALVENNPSLSLRDICATANTGRLSFKHRAAFLFTNKEELLQQLEEFASSDSANSGQTETGESRSLAREALDALKAFTAANRQDRSDLQIAAEAFLRGAEVDWGPLYQAGSWAKAQLPTYPFEKKRCWLAPQYDLSVISNPIKPAVAERAGFQVVLAGRADQKYTELEHKVANVWGECLGYSQMNVTDNYFDLGGDSIYAMRILNRVHEVFSTRLDLTSLLAHPTIEQFALEVGSSMEQISRQEAITKVKDQEFYPLTPTQHEVFEHSQLEGLDIVYNMPFIINVERPLTTQQTTEAFQYLIRRHAALRTIFYSHQGSLVQKILKEASLSISYKKASKMQLPALMKSFVRPFDLSQAPLLRVEQIELKPDHHLLFVDMHYIISDGNAMKTIVEELARFLDGEAVELPEWEYKDFLVWNDRNVNSDQMLESEAFWLELFKGDLPVLQIQSDYDRPDPLKYDVSEIACLLSEDTTRKLKDLASRENVTLYMLLLALWNIVLAYHSGQDDIIVGSTIVDRSFAGFDNVVGQFGNMFALRNRPHREKHFLDFLGEVRASTLQAFQHRSYPFNRLLTRLPNLKKDSSRNPLFDTIFVLQNNLDFTTRFNGISVLPFQKRHARFDLGMAANERNNCLSLGLRYYKSIYKRSTAMVLVSHYADLCRIIVDNPQIRIGNIQLKENAIYSMKLKWKLLFNPILKK